MYCGSFEEAWKSLKVIKWHFRHGKDNKRERYIFSTYMGGCSLCSTRQYEEPHWMMPFFRTGHGTYKILEAKFENEKFNRS